MDALQQRYVERMKERVKRMRIQLEGGNWAELKGECHQVKGSAATYGFAELSELAGHAEHWTSRSEAEARSAVNKLIEAMESVIAQGESK